MTDSKDKDGETKTKLFEKIKYKISGKINEDVSTVYVLIYAGIKVNM